MDTSVCTRWSGSPQLPCRQSNTANQHGACIICAKCALRLHCVPKTGCSDDIRLNTVIGITAGGSRTRMSLLRDNDLRSRRTEASEEEGSTTNDGSVQHGVQFRTSIVDDGRGLTVVNTLLGRLARKLQRGGSPANADLSAAIQTVLGAATADQCDSVDICCCACDCLLRNAPHLAISEPDRFRQFFFCRSSFANWWWHLLKTASEMCSVELREIRAQQESCGRELLFAACDSCCFPTREHSLLEHHWCQFLTSDGRFKECMSLQCRRNRAHVWKQSGEGKRVYPSAMIQRLERIPSDWSASWCIILFMIYGLLSISPSEFVAAPAPRNR